VVVTVRLLLDAGSGPLILDKSGATPLHLAVLSGRATIADMLISAGAQVDSINDKEQTPLH
jgi:ankyrin repeat protein